MNADRAIAKKDADVFFMMILSVSHAMDRSLLRCVLRYRPKLQCQFCRNAVSFCSALVIAAQVVGVFAA